MGYGVKPLLISAAMDSTIRLWDVATQKQIETLQYKVESATFVVRNAL